MTSIFEASAEAGNSSSDDDLDPITRSWKEARQMAAVIGPCPRLFTTAVHFLNVDTLENNDVPTRSSKGCLNLLLRSDSFAAAFYFAAKTYRAEELKSTALSKRIRLVDLFKASDLAAMVTVLYLYRRLRKGCDEELFGQVTRDLIVDTEIAGKIGQSMDSIGLGYGLLVGTFSYLGHGLMLGIDKKKFKKYRMRLKVDRQPFDLEEEHRLFGCDHLQLAVLMAQTVGMRKELLDPLMRGLQAKFLYDTEQEKLMYAARLTHHWLQELKRTGKAPDMTHLGEFYPMASALQDLEESAQKISAEGALHAWLTRAKQDVSEQDTPELFRTAPQESSEDFGDDDVPEEFESDIDIDQALDAS